MANNYVDFKVTVWSRAHFNDDADMEKVKEALINGASSNDICDEDSGLGYSGEWETLLDTEDVLTPDTNNGDSTIEVYKDADSIWENGKNPLKL